MPEYRIPKITDQHKPKSKIYQRRQTNIRNSLRLITFSHLKSFINQILKNAFRINPLARVLEELGSNIDQVKFCPEWVFFQALIVNAGIILCNRLKRPSKSLLPDRSLITSTYKSILFDCCCRKNVVTKFEA